MSWKITTNNHVRRDVLAGFELSDEAIDELGLDVDDEDDMSADFIRYKGMWLALGDFTIGVPDALREAGWQGWLPRGAGNSDTFVWLVRFGDDPFDFSLPTLGYAEWQDEMEETK